MHRMTQLNPPALFVALMAVGLTATTGILSATAAPPDVQHVGDLPASGFVMPAGMAPQAIYQGGVVPVDFQCDTIDGSFYGPGENGSPGGSGGSYVPGNGGNAYAPGNDGNAYAPGSGGNTYAPDSGGGSYAPGTGGNTNAPGNNGFPGSNNNYSNNDRGTNDRGTGIFDSKLDDPCQDEYKDPCDRCGGGGIFDKGGLFHRMFGGKEETCPECQPGSDPCAPGSAGYFGQPGCEPCAPGSAGYYGQPGTDPCAPSYYGQPAPCAPGMGGYAPGSPNGAGPCGPGPCGPGPCGPGCYGQTGPMGGGYAPGPGGNYGPNGAPYGPGGPGGPGGYYGPNEGGLFGGQRGRRLGPGLNNALSKLGRLCFFCQGGGCSLCQSLKTGNLKSMLHSLRPFGGEGFCTQRWYDISAEVTFLTHSDGGLSGPVTTLGVAPGGTPVLDLSGPDGGDDFEAGARVSAAFIWGPGGNIEATYMGGNRWRSEAAAIDDPGATLYSFVSDFGTNPGAGYDDTDRSIVQSLNSDSEFNSFELNYRRRTVGPYCRFQSSWLFGLRYVRYEDGLLYSTLGDTAGTRFFSSSDNVKNNVWGPQIGLDVWWHVLAGLRIGAGAKGAWVRNDLDRRTELTANSLASAVIIDDSAHQSTIMGDLELKIVYRINHSWALRGAYYLTAIDKVAFGTADRDTIRDFVTASPITQPGYHINSLTTQGFGFGAEYRW
jgi:hypothetical protein